MLAHYNLVLLYTLPYRYRYNISPCRVVSFEITLKGSPLTSKN